MIATAGKSRFIGNNCWSIGENDTIHDTFEGTKHFKFCLKMLNAQIDTEFKSRIAPNALHTNPTNHYVLFVILMTGET